MTKIVLTGMSHTACLYHAMTAEEKANTAYFRLKNAAVKWSDKDQVHSYFKARQLKPELVILCLHGNFHNQIGILEHPEKFTTATAHSIVVPEDPDRTFISRSVMLDVFRSRLNPTVKIMRAIHAVFPEARFVHASPPPPINDAEHIKNNPGVFEKMISLGVSPKDLRKALFDMQTELSIGIAKELGARFVLPPAAALTADGLLKNDFTSADPTHANVAYGRMMLDRVLQQMEAA